MDSQGAKRGRVASQGHFPEQFRALVTFQIRQRTVRIFQNPSKRLNNPNFQLITISIFHRVWKSAPRSKQFSSPQLPEGEEALAGICWARMKLQATNFHSPLSSGFDSGIFHYDTHFPTFRRSEFQLECRIYHYCAAPGDGPGLGDIPRCETVETSGSRPPPTVGAAGFAQAPPHSSLTLVSATHLMDETNNLQ